MGSSRWIGVVGVGAGLWLCLVPSAWAADGDASEAAETPTISKEFAEQLKSVIETETDPELKEAMREQLGQLETGTLNLRDAAESQPQRENRSSLAASANDLGGKTLPAGIRPETRPPTETGRFGGPAGEVVGAEKSGDYLPGDVREKLYRVFDDVTKGGRSDEQARGEAEKILKEHGIEPRMERGEGLEHAGEHRGPEALDRMSKEGLEHMAPEARERLEGMTRDTAEQRDAHTRERSAQDAPQREAREGSGREGGQREARESSQREAVQREAPQHEARESREMNQREGSQQEAHEAPQHEAREGREAPQHEAREAREAPQHEAREARETPQREAPQREAVERETPQREAMQREAPEREMFQREAPEAMQREMPEQQPREFQAPESQLH